MGLSRLSFFPSKSKKIGLREKDLQCYVATPLKFKIPKMMLWKMYLLSNVASLGIYVTEGIKTLDLSRCENYIIFFFVWILFL